MRTISTNQKEYHLYWTTGTVENTGKNMETRVHGGGGGGMSYRGTGGTAPVTITSTTVVHDQIFLTDADGKEHSFQLQGFNVACREGNKLSILWAIKSGSKTGPYIVVYNHTTSKAFFDDKELRKIFSYHWLYPLGISIAILALLSSMLGGYAFMLAIAVWIYWYYNGSQNIKQFKSETRFADF